MEKRAVTADWISPMLAVLAAVASMLIGIVVWFSDRANRLRTVFLWVAISISVWIVSNVVYNSGLEDIRYPMALVSYMAAMFVVVTVLAFVMRLVKYREGRARVTLLLFGYIFGGISAIPGVVGLGVEGISIITRPEGIVMYGVVLIAYLLLACFILIRHLKTAGRVLRRQIRLILLGIFITSIIGVTFNLIFPMFGNYNFTQLGPAGALVFVASIAYSIARYNLFDIRLAIVRFIAYTATVIALVTVFFIFAYTVAAAFNSSFMPPEQFAINIIAALAMAAVLQPIKRFFDKATDQIFFRDNYSTDEFYGVLNKVLSGTSDLRELLERIAHLVAEKLKSDQVFFFTYVADGRHMSAGTEHHARLATAEVRMLDEYVVTANGKLLIENQLEAGDAIRRMMVSHQISLILPLMKSKETIGYICLGARRSGDYNRRDHKLLETIADELVIAIQNAQSVQVVKDLNSSLEQRISSATKELRMSNAQLQRLDEAKDEFISMASHQLRTPLTSVKGYVSMLLEGDAGKISDEQKHLLNEVFISSERMVRLIGDFLNVSRLQTGKFVIEKHPIDLALLVEREIDGLAQNATVKEVKFEYKRPKDIPILDLDENKIQQVIMNFLDNAMYYSKEKSKITVSLKKVANHVEFKVIDKGIGVPENEQAHLFNKFFRATNARRARPDGTGVGLFLAKKVIDDHDGKIIFESKEGKGSIFGFELPLPKE